MIYGLYLSAAGALASQHRMEVIANNLANVQTTGFKRDLATFREAPLEADLRRAPAAFRHPVADGIGGGIFAQPTFTDLRPGPLRHTRDPSDLAIAGEGFFVVDTPAGKRLTRDGRISISPAGHLVRATDGLALLGANGEQIRVDPAQGLQVASDGTVQQEGVAVSRLAVVRTADREDLRKAGGGLFRVLGEAGTRPADARVRQGYLEDSGVEPTTELTNLILANRSYELNARMLQQQDQTLGRLINTVASLR